MVTSLLLEVAAEVLRRWHLMTGLILPLAQTVSLKKIIRVLGYNLIIQRLEVGAGLLTGTVVFLFVPQRQRFHWMDLSKLSSMLASFEAKIGAALTMTRLFDVPCLFGRDISKFRDFACAWYDMDYLANSTAQPISSVSAASNLRIYGKPPKIIYLNDFMLESGSKQQRLIDGFVEDLEYALGVKKSIISLSKEWELSYPGDLTKQGLQQYMKNVCTILPTHFTPCLDIIQAPTHAFFFDLYHDFDRFREDFNAKYERAPYVSPMLRWRWLALYLAYHIRS